MGGRKRLHGKGLPRHVYLNRGWYFYRPAKKWYKLAREGDLQGMHAALANHLAGATAGTMRPVFQYYREHELPKKGAKTQDEQERQLKRLEDVFGDDAQGSITAEDVEDYLENRIGKVAANREMALLSHVYTTGARWPKPYKFRFPNPCTGVKRNPESADPKPADSIAIIKAWPYATPPLRAYCALLYVTGVRPSDAFKFRETDFGPNGLLVEPGKTKKRSNKQLSLSHTINLRYARQFAIAQRKVTPTTRHLLVTEDGLPFTRSAMKSAWARWMTRVKKAGLDTFTPKSLRSKSATDHPDGSHLGHVDPRVLNKHYRAGPRKVTPI